MRFAIVRFGVQPSTAPFAMKGQNMVCFGYQRLLLCLFIGLAIGWRLVASDRTKETKPTTMPTTMSTIDKN